MHSLLEMLPLIYTETKIIAGKRISIINEEKKLALATILTGIADDVIKAMGSEAAQQELEITNYMRGIAEDTKKDAKINIAAKTSKIFEKILKFVHDIMNDATRSHEIYDKFYSQLNILGFTPSIAHADTVLALTDKEHILQHMQQFYTKIKPDPEKLMSFDLTQPNFVSHAIKFVNSALPDDSNIVILCQIEQVEFLKEKLAGNIIGENPKQISVCSYGIAGFCEFMKEFLKQEISISTSIIRDYSANQHSSISSRNPFNINALPVTAGKKKGKRFSLT